MTSIVGVKVEATAYGDRKVFSVSAFNRGIATWLQRLPTVWVEGEVTELKRHQQEERCRTEQEERCRTGRKRHQQEEHRRMR